MKVPVFDLSRARAQIEEQLLERWAALLQSTAFVQGPEVTEFESAFAESLGASGCVAVANGTDALTLALKALDVAPGDEVLMPAFTFFATYESIVLAGAVPVVVDIDPRTYSIDLEAAASRVSERTVGMVGVHLYGCPVDHQAMDRFCEERSLWWVEDAAQAHGSASHGKPAGRLGRLASWSFYPSKNLGCFGDGDCGDQGACSGPAPQTGGIWHTGRIGTTSAAQCGFTIGGIGQCQLYETIPGQADPRPFNRELAQVEMLLTPVLEKVEQRRDEHD